MSRDRVKLPPKPPKVADHYQYWGEQPPEPSARLIYWVEQIEAGFRPNRRVMMMGYDSTAQWFGCYMWEYLNVLAPLFQEER